MYGYTVEERRGELSDVHMCKFVYIHTCENILGHCRQTVELISIKLLTYINIHSRSVTKINQEVFGIVCIYAMYVSINSVVMHSKASICIDIPLIQATLECTTVVS